MYLEESVETSKPSEEIVMYDRPTLRKSIEEMLTADKVPDLTPTNIRLYSDVLERIYYSSISKEKSEGLEFNDLLNDIKNDKMAVEKNKETLDKYFNPSRLQRLFSGSLSAPEILQSEEIGFLSYEYHRREQEYRSGDDFLVGLVKGMYNCNFFNSWYNDGKPLKLSDIYLDKFEELRSRLN